MTPSVLDCPLLIDQPCETHTTVLLSFPFSPTSLSVIPLPPPPPPCASLLTLSPCTPSPHTENDQPSLVWFDRGKFYLTFEGKLSLHRLVCVCTPSSEARLCKLPLSCLALPSPFHSSLTTPSIRPPMLTPGSAPSKQLNSAAWFSSTAFLLIVHSNFLSKP